MAIENIIFLDEVGIEQLSEALLSKVNNRVSERIIQELSDASDEHHVVSALLLNQLLKTRDEKISANKTTIDANTEAINNVKISVTEVTTKNNTNISDMVKVTEDAKSLNTKVDGLTHLETHIIVGSVQDIADPRTDVLYLQKDSEEDTTWMLYVYLEDGTWVPIGDTAVDLSGYWSKDDTTIKDTLSVPDMDSLTDDEIAAIVDTAFKNTDVLKPPTPVPPTEFTVTKDNRSLIGYTGEVNENLVIPATFTGDDNVEYVVTKIDTSSFKDCTNLSSVTIPDTVTLINSFAFAGCSSLSSVTIPEVPVTRSRMKSGMRVIEDAVFKDCVSLESIVIPDLFISGATGLFENCVSLRSVTLYEETNQIPSVIFKGCTSLEYLRIPNSVKHINQYAFYGSSLTHVDIDAAEGTIVGDFPWFGVDNITFTYLRELFDVTEDGMLMDWDEFFRMEAWGRIPNDIIIPESINGTTVTWIRDNFVRDNQNITSVTIPSTVNEIWGNVFEDGYSLTSINICNSEDSIMGAPWGAPNATVTWNYGDTDDSVSFVINELNRGMIGYADFGDPLDLDIPATFTGDDGINYKITGIDFGAFQNCYNLNSVRIPDTVTSIGDSAFFQCIGLKTVTIGTGVKELPADVFFGCENLTTIDISNNLDAISGAPWGATNATVRWTFEYFVISENGLGELSASSELQALTADHPVDLIIPKRVNGINVESIGFCGFQTCLALRSVTIPTGVTSISEYAFSGCKSLESITIPDSVLEIKDVAFNDCSSLKSINIPNSVIYMGGSTFINCQNLTTVNIDNVPDSIPDSPWGAESAAINWLR